jgi:tetratricopeptide (TPR) repeat protein
VWIHSQQQSTIARSKYANILINESIKLTLSCITDKVEPMRNFKHLTLWIVILWLALMPRFALAQILDSVEVNRADGAAVIWIHFTVPVRYDRHFPSESGQILQIYVTVSPVGGEKVSGGRDVKTFRAKPGDPWSLLEVKYDGDGTEGPNVVLRFNKSTQFRVQQGKDGRSIVVLVPAPLGKKGAADGGAAPDAEHSYALTLASSAEPFSDFSGFVAGVKNIVPDAQVYTVAAKLFGKPVYYTRVGFFDSYEEAEAAKEKLLAAYPGAWTTPVGDIEHAAAVGGAAPAEPSELPLKAPPPAAPLQHKEPAKAPVDVAAKAAARREDAAPVVEAREGTQPGKMPDKMPADSGGSALAERREKPAAVVGAAPADSPKADQLMADARSALERGDNAQASKALNAILSLPDNKHTQDAQELLGLALERNSQAPMAMVEYSLYLKRYRDGEGPERVRQRLAELSSAASATAKKQAPPTDAVSADALKSEQLMKDGREALTNGDNARAIGIFNALLKMPDNSQTRDAQEFLGLALERAGRAPQAIVEYSLYLKRYPNGEGADRVRLRVANIAPAEVRSIAILRPAKEPSAGEWSVNGTLSQDYFYGKSQTSTLTTSSTGVDVRDPAVARVDVNFLSTRASVTGRYRSSRYENQIVVDGDASHTYLDATQSKPRVGSFYGEIKDREIDYSARIGRQSGSSGGVLGRFDGGQFGYKLSPKLRVHAVAGVPVDTIAPTSDRKFAGASLEMGTFAQHWNGTAYFIQQQVDGIIDRQAVGLEVRFFHQMGTVFSLMDYDVHHKVLNLFLLQGNLLLSDQTSINMMMDYRKSPYALTTNALMNTGPMKDGKYPTSIAQVVQEKGWSDADITERIKAFAPTVKTFSLGAYRPLTEKLQIGADFSASSTSATPPLGSDPTAPDYYPGSAASGTSLSYSMNLIGSRLLLEKDVAVLSVGRGTGPTFTATNVGLTVRAPYSAKGYVNASLRWNKQSTTQGTESDRLTPTLRLDYQLAKDITIEAEYQKEFSKTRGPSYGDDTNRDFYRIGWRWDF